MLRPTGLFVTGTDTGVGKTAVAVAIIRQLVSEGVGVGVYKPVASGTVATDPGGDPARLHAAAGGRRPLDEVCPQIFASPCAPSDAARAEGRRVDERLLRTGIERCRDGNDFVVVEGAGGLCSPLGDQTLVADLARVFGYPLVLVDDVRLGSIGRTLATLHAARALGLAVAAVVLSEVIRPADPPVVPPAAAHPARIAAAGVAFLARTVRPLPVLRLGHGAAAIEPSFDWLAGCRARADGPAAL